MEEITSLNANISGTTISVNGTAKSTVLAVQFIVYDKTGQNIIKMYSTAVNGDGTFSAEIAVDTNDTYIVSAADYDGGQTVMVTVGASTEDTLTAGTPETGFQTITKVQEEVTPSTNATSSSAIYVYIAVGLVSAAIAVLFTRRMLAKRNSK
ncbi:hypothetical protein IJH16_02015 [Candidatus Saccharibacteria bacterium]|nr:hypothetical protein [Candidatus Saccharibacteria bacterium]